MFTKSKLFVYIAAISLFFLKHIDAKEPKTLVVILAETREADKTFENFKKNVLDPLKADLAVCIGVKKGQPPKDLFVTHAKYRFYYPEPDDYATAFDEAAAVIAQQNPELETFFPWRDFLDIKDQFLGGIKHPSKEHPGSAGILIFFRWFLLQNILENGLLQEYDFFVITRSDHMYVLPHPSMEFSNEKISIPTGEGYGGLTDRHVVLPRKFVVPYLDILTKMVTNGQNYIQKMRSNSLWNLERFIKFHLCNHGILKHVQLFPRIMYAMRSEGGSTRWVSGQFSQQHGYYIKYPSEYQEAERTKAKFLNSGVLLEDFYKTHTKKLYTNRSSK